MGILMSPAGCAPGISSAGPLPVVERVGELPAANDLLARNLGQVMAFCRDCAGGQLPAEDRRLRWEAFFRELAPYVRRVALTSGVKPADLDDCCQEAWMEVVRRLGEGRFDQAGGNFAGWMFTVVRNRSIDFVRSRARNPEVCHADLDFLPTQHDLDPAVLYQRKCRQALLYAALDELVGRLSAATYESLYQSSICEREGSAVAEELGLTVAQVRYRRRRAKRSLRELLAYQQGWAELLED